MPIEAEEEQPKPGRNLQSILLRVAILLLGLIILATVFVGGSAVISHLRSAATPQASPTPSPTGQTYYPYSDPKNEFQMRLPDGWNQRIQIVTSTNIALILGPQPPFPAEDYVYVGVYPNPGYVPTALASFNNGIQKGLGSDAQIVSSTPFQIGGLPGYFYIWGVTQTDNAPNGAFHAGYYLLDGDRIVAIVLQVQPLTDRQSFTNMLPIFQATAQSFVSFHQSQPSPSPSPSASATATVTPTARASP